jgi:tetratricopeptide (TPR) repeat protein
MPYFPASVTGGRASTRGRPRLCGPSALPWRGPGWIPNGPAWSRSPRTPRHRAGLRHATRLAATLFRYLDLGGHYPEAVTIHGHARNAARCTGDRVAEAHALTSLGVVDARKSRYQQAGAYLRQSLPLFRAGADLAGEARALTNLRFVDFQQGHYEQAASPFERAAAQFRDIGDQAGEALARGNLGDAFLAAGRPVDSRVQHDRALGVTRQIGDKYEQARARNGLGHAYHALGDLARARRQWERTLILYACLSAPEADQIRTLLAAST